jgi:hypothetical protein
MTGITFGDLLFNASFETQSTNGSANARFWDTENGGGVDSSDVWGNAERADWNTPPAGSYAVYLKGTWSGSDFGGIWQRVTAAPDTLYEVTGDFYTDNGFTGLNAFKLEFLDSSRTFLTAYTNRLTDLVDSTWVTRDVSGVSPANTAFIQVVFETGSTGAGGVIGGDNFNLTAVPEPSVGMLMLIGMLLTGATIKWFACAG